MYLEKLQIQGFKSFANKNVLVFPGMLDKTRRGLTAIVGPNGSGKSNVADAVRWALGEQSMKTLRGKKSEDVIFSGSDKKGKLGMAEVSLFLNNEDPRHGGAGKKAPIDYSEIVLSRRLYRNGDSEYLINNSRVRLSDIQMLLAKASFGQKTYSVIGQGMVEGFLNTSLAERKEFFDEATGVKQYQIKRDDSLNKLRHSYENLNQASMLISEIEPRLNSLTRQVNKLKKRDELENELKELQLRYYSYIWHDINAKFTGYNNDYLKAEKVKIEKEKKLEQLNGELRKFENQNQINEDFENYQRELSNLQAEKEQYVNKLARIDAQIEMGLEREGKFDISWLLNKKSELEKNIQRLNGETSNLDNNNSSNQITELENEKTRIEKKINDLNKQILSLSNQKDSREELKRLYSGLKTLVLRFDELEKEEDIKKIKNLIKSIKGELRGLAKESDDQEIRVDLEKIQTEIINLSKQKEEIVNRINDIRIKSSSILEKSNLLKAEKERAQAELNSLAEKIKGQESELGHKELSQDKENLKKETEAVDRKIIDIKTKINNISRNEEEKRNKLFSLQRNIQELQNEVNSLNNELNEIKINSTRYETRLEDLEVEIRHNLGGLREVKETAVEGEVNQEEARSKIDSIKRQLEQIGGIDPEIEKEYIETKERYDFLSGQVNDLEGAIKSLEKVIKELDLTIKEKFDKEFKLIQEKFQEYFKILFNGGNAKIIKVMDTDEVKSESKKAKDEEGGEDQEAESFTVAQDGEGVVDLKKIKFLQKHNATGLAGIEIQATPPGKKIASISMLSGGERALTAIAMICAIISANPSPFVVLDEVDAALDEANSERLAKILDDLSHKTQFIVITHNRASMRRANILYGVTMGDDGISKLLSVKLDEVEVG